MVLIVFGVWLIKGKRDVLDEQRRLERMQALAGAAPATGWRDRAKAWKLRLAEPTRLVFGLASAITGYHLAAWVLPDAWSPMHVPLEKWWILAVSVVAAVGGTVWVDRWEANHPGGTAKD